MTVPTVYSELAALDLEPVIVLPRDISLRRAASAMATTSTTAVLIDGTPVRILTERDVVRAMASGRTGDDLAREVATPDPLVIPERGTVLEAAETMVHHHIGHLVIVDEELHPIAIVSARRVADALLCTLERPPWIGALRVALRIM